jgi:kynurenine formamidase
VIDASERKGRAIDVGYFEDLDFPSLKDRAVLISTGWDAHWRTQQYGEDAPFITNRAAQFLIEAKPALVGIDSVNIDDKLDGARPAHTLLLGAGIPIAEHLCNLDQLPLSGFRFHCVPVKFRGVGTFPVRAYAVIE